MNTFLRHKAGATSRVETSACVNRLFNSSLATPILSLSVESNTKIIA